jgi:hypothetical protein
MTEILNQNDISLYKKYEYDTAELNSVMIQCKEEILVKTDEYKRANEETNEKIDILLKSLNLDRIKDNIKKEEMGIKRLGNMW